jgi:hypothetical protein
MAIIYAKTAAGRQEIETRSRRIPPRMRAALILVDGHRSDDELRKLIQQPDQTLQSLLDAGLIEVMARTAPARPAAAPEPSLGAAAPQALSADDLRLLRRDSVRAINDLLGPDAEALALRIERAVNAGDLRAALERAVEYIATARGGGAAAQFSSRFLSRFLP